MQSPCFSIESVVSVSSKFVLLYLTLLVIIFYSLCRSTEASTCWGVGRSTGQWYCGGVLNLLNASFNMPEHLSFFVHSYIFAGDAANRRLLGDLASSGYSRFSVFVSIIFAGHLRWRSSGNECAWHRSRGRCLRENVVALCCLHSFVFSCLLVTTIHRRILPKKNRFVTMTAATDYLIELVTCLRSHPWSSMGRVLS